jgi:uncharacterized protein (DUF2336 family)
MPAIPAPVATEPSDDPELAPRGGADTQEAFDLASLLGTGEPPPIVDLSGVERPPARILLEGTIPSRSFSRQEQEEDHAVLDVPEPKTLAADPSSEPPIPSLAEEAAADAKASDLKQLRLPALPAIDEFALLDETAAPAKGTLGGPHFDGSPTPAPQAVPADPPTPAFWQRAEPETQAPAEGEALASQPAERESEEAGDVARSLLEIMSLPANATQPQERALAADSLLHLLHRLPLKTLIAMVERLSLMESPPRLILAELIHDERIEVAGPLLEKCSAIDDQDLLAVIADGRQHSNRMIARRRSLTSAICDALIAAEDTSAILTLVRNPGAVISHEAFFKLNELARRHPALQAPLATRADLPAPVAFELFWVLPVELRRYVISRFLTDSVTLNKILKLTQRMDQEQEAPPRFASAQDIERLAGLLSEPDPAGAEQLMAALLGIAPPTARRIVADMQGEPLAVAFKAAGASRADFERLLAGLKEAGSAADLQGLFETLSFNKARVLLTYWDWAVSRSGPYAALTS